MLTKRIRKSKHEVTKYKTHWTTSNMPAVSDRRKITHNTRSEVDYKLPIQT